MNNPYGPWPSTATPGGPRILSRPLPHPSQGAPWYYTWGCGAPRWAVSPEAPSQGGPEHTFGLSPICRLCRAFSRELSLFVSLAEAAQGPSLQNEPGPNPAAQPLCAHCSASTQQWPVLGLGTLAWPQSLWRTPPPPDLALVPPGSLPVPPLCRALGQALGGPHKPKAALLTSWVALGNFLNLTGPGSPHL